MAVLGVQVVFSLIAFSFLQKLSQRYSFALWLISNRLVRYLHPTNEQLKTAAGFNAPYKRGRRTVDFRPSDRNQFTVPRSISLDLDLALFSDVDLVRLRYFSEYQWLMDYSLCALFVYIVTEITFFLGFIKVDYNISVLWCLLALAFSVRVLISQLVMYLKAEEGGERILCISFGLFFLVFSMGILIIDQDYLEFGLQDGYKNFSESARVFMIKSGFLNHGPVSIKTFNIVLTISSAILGTFLTFPGLRFAKTYLDSVKYSKELPLRTLILHLNFIFPVMFLLLWIKPIGRDIFCEKHNILNREPFLRHETFDMIRIAVGLFICLLRLTLLTTHLQSHLNLAYERVQRMRKESGKIGSKDLQRMVARVSHYLCIVCVQYVTPMLLMLFSLLLLKTLGSYSWLELFTIKPYPVIVQNQNTTFTSLFNNATGTFLETAAEVSETLGNLRSLFTFVWYRGLLSYLTWWINTAWFATTLFGVAYHSKFTD